MFHSTNAKMPQNKWCFKKDAACNGPAPFTSFHLFLLWALHNPYSTFLFDLFFEYFILSCVLQYVLSVLSRISSGVNHEFQVLNAKKLACLVDFSGMHVDMRHGGHFIQVLRANLPSSLSWRFPFVLDRQQNCKHIRKSLYSAVH